MKVHISLSSASFISVVVVCHFVISSMLRSILDQKTPNIQINKKLYKLMSPRWLCVRVAWRICHFSPNLVLMFVCLYPKCSPVHDQRVSVFEEEPSRCLLFFFLTLLISLFHYLLDKQSADRDCLCCFLAD